MSNNKRKTGDGISLLISALSGGIIGVATEFVPGGAAGKAAVTVGGIAAGAGLSIMKHPQAKRAGAALMGAAASEVAGVVREFIALRKAKMKLTDEARPLIGSSSTNSKTNIGDLMRVQASQLAALTRVPSQSLAGMTSHPLGEHSNWAEYYG